MNTNPIISVIVPIYNVEKYIRRCIESILAQTFADFELLLVDDGSSDNCPSVCDSYAERDTRVIVIHKANGGLPAARKSGFERAKGDYIAFVDGDDWVELQYLELLYACAKENNSDLVFCGFKKQYAHKTECEDHQLPADKNDMVSLYLRFPVYMNSFCNKLIRTNLLQKDDVSFPFGISMGEDMFVTFKLVQYASRISQVHEALYNYDRSNEHSITHTITEKHAQDHLRLSEDMMRFLENHHIQQFISVAQFYCLKAKLLFLILHTFDKKTWLSLHPDSHAYIWKVPLRIDYKVMLWLASKGLFAPTLFIQKIKQLVK